MIGYLSIVYMYIHVSTDWFYLKVQLFAGILLLELKTQFVWTKCCDLYAKMVQGRQFVMFSNVHNKYRISRFEANSQKYQTLLFSIIPAKNSHLKVVYYVHRTN